MIHIESAGFVAYPCQGGGGMTCRAPLAPKRAAEGGAVTLLSGDGQPVTLGGTIECALCGWLGMIRDGQIETITPGSPARVDRALAAHFGDEL